MPTTDIEDHNDIRLADGVTAYHGSPHEFEEFDPAFIGTGEGAQAYGHGLYFAENEGVARNYLGDPEARYKRLSGHMEPKEEFAFDLATNSSDPRDMDIMVPLVKKYGINIDFDEAQRLATNALKKRGHMYEVQIDAHPEEHMLDWDKPLSEQHPKIQEAVSSRIEHLRNKYPEWVPNDPEGEWIYRSYRPQGEEEIPPGIDHDAHASSSLKDLGVRGIRYADQGSRPHGTDSKIKKDLQSARNNLEYLEKSSDPDSEYLKELSKKHIAHLENILNDYASKTTHNYVIFDPQHIKVKRRYAKGGGIKAFAIGNSIPHLERASDMIDTHDDIQLAPDVAAIDAMPDQAFTSENTSRNQIPALFNSPAFERKRGSRNLDYGGGAFDKGTEYLAKEHGVESHVYDPFNRPKEHNDFVLKGFKKEPADTATVANVLNVIAEPEARLHVIKQVHNHIKPDGKAYFTVYEGDGKDKGSGNSRMTRDGWQEYRPTHSYVEEIKQVFPDVRLSGKTIVASKKPAKAYGGSIIPGPRLTEDNADDFARRLIAWTFATAPLFQRAAGGEVTYPVSMPEDIKEDIKAGKAKLKKISPQEFLNEADPLHIGKGDRNIIDSFEHHIEHGRKLGPLKLYEEGHQDGRHRANAAKALGVKKVPVVDYRKADGGAVDDPAQTAVDTARQISPMGFYSAAAEAASKFPQRAPIDQIINKIKGQPNVKKEELDNANLADAFAGQRSVDPKEVARHLQKSIPQIGEKVYSDIPDEKFKELRQQYARSEYGDHYYDLPSEWKRKVDDLIRDRHGNPSYEKYTIPGGKNYREVVMTLPWKRPHNAEVSQNKHGEWQIIDPLSNNRHILNATNYEDALQEGEERLRSVAPGSYRSSHWSGVTNPIAHLRMSDRDDGKTLHLEELQSDWGQEAQKIRKQEIKRIVKEKGIDKKEASKLVPSDFGFKDPNEKRADSLLDQMIQDFSFKLPRAPYVTDTGQWVDLGLKRALMEAAKGGYDKLIWTPGEEQANRYNLRKHVEALSYDPEDKVLSYLPHGGNKGRGYIDIPGKIEPHEIEEHIGKEAAERLLAAEPNKLSGNHNLSGEDLEVGGEGMQAFYDKLVPQRLSKLIAQYDPEAKVQLHSHKVTIPGETGQKLTALRTIDPTNSSGYEDKDIMAHSIQITPKLREAILKGGLPAFEKGGSVIDAALDVVSKLRR